MAGTPEDAIRSMIENLKANTGRSLPEWLKLTSKSGLTKHGQIMTWLKKEHGMTHGYANLVAHQTLQSGTVFTTNQNDNVDLVAAQYANSREKLRPIYDAFIKKAAALGKDVEVSPKKTYVSLRRNKQFALIQPGAHVTIGLNLKGVEPQGRLQPSGSFNSMCSHKVVLDGPKDIDAELMGWVKQAYEKA
jgi:predicted transport protein